MSSLDSLIRLHRWRLDEQRRHVVSLEELSGKLRAELERLDAEQAAEQQVAGSSMEAAYGFGSYVGAAVDRRHKLVRSLADADQQVTTAREALGEIFQEVKRYEIAAARRLLNQRVLMERQDQQVMDQIAIDIHRRLGAKIDKNLL